MKIGLLSDAHGNPSGLANCLAYLESRKVGKIFFLGDAVGYLPRWTAVLELLRVNNVFCLRGNHDARLFNDEALANANEAYQLWPKYIESIRQYRPWIETWPSSHSVSMDGKRLLFVHGSPMSPTEGYVYPWTGKEAFQAVDADVVFMGHTHRPFVQSYMGKLLVNVGSCGLPRDHGALSACAVYDTEETTCEIFRLRFDTNEVIADSPGIHSSVEQCLHRTSMGYIGTLIGVV